ncbi:MAG: TIGR00730 family Rossman fold protein [Bacteroidetes bacterium]|nr:TIGR00730 family Rossman fold protein [Bacteroidota bacterium]
MKSICVFCGSSTGENIIYAEAAKELGKLFVKEKITLVYGGAKVGLMGIIADEVIANGGKSIGVIPDFFSTKEIAHTQLTELIYVSSMAERKAVLADLSDAFIAMPGGFGTLDELFEMMTASQLDLHKKSVGILNTNRYYDALIAQLDRMQTDQFMKAVHRQMLLDDENPHQLLEKLRHYEAPSQEKWIRKIKE